MNYLGVAVIIVVFAYILILRFKNQLKELTPGAFLVDVRTAAEFASGSAPGAVNIPLNEIKQSMAQFQDKDEIVVFCRSGNRSAQARSILQKNGIKNVQNGGTWKNVKSLLEQSKNNS